VFRETQRQDALIRLCEICPARLCSFPARLRENAVFSVLRTLMFSLSLPFLILYIGRRKKKESIYAVVVKNEFSILAHSDANKISNTNKEF